MLRFLVGDNTQNNKISKYPNINKFSYLSNRNRCGARDADFLSEQFAGKVTTEDLIAHASE
jgi:hypothetical protein